jgi:vacuolar-type H+-ATPase subunit F/Vma7
MITINIDKAKVITKNRLRAERTPLLQAQDVAFQRAIETGADTSVIVVEKQRLRDITALADKANTLDELKAITPIPANAVKV